MSEKRAGKGRRMGSSRRETRGNRIQRGEGKPEGIEGLVEEDGLTYTGVKEGGGADEATPHKPAEHESKLLLPSMEIDPSHESSSSAHLQQSDSLVQTSVEPALMTEGKDLVHYEEPVGSSINDIQQSQTQMECRTEFKSPVALTRLYESEKIVSTKGHENPICSRNPESENTLSLESVEKSRVNINSSAGEASENTGECLRVDDVQHTSVPIPDKREKRRKMGSTRKSSRRAEVQTETGEEEDVIMGQEREEGEDSSLLEDELGSEITGPSGEIKAEKQDENRIHQNTEQVKENYESQVGDRKTSDISTCPPEISDENMPVRCEGEISVQEREGHQEESVERGIQPDAKDRSADTMEYEDTTLAQETSLPVPARRERRRKMGSTRKSSRRAEVQTERGEEEDVIMGQEREEGEDSSLLEEELGSEITATSREIQTEKQDEKWIHQNTDQDKENESQVGDRKTSGISTRPPEISDDSEQAEHYTFSVEKEREDKEESNGEREMEQVGTYHTPDISDYSDQAEHSTFVNKELHTDTPLTFGRTESVGQSEAESTKHENMFEDTVILDQLKQSEDNLLTEKDSALSVTLTDAQQRSLELEEHSQQSEEGETRNVEDKSPGEDSKRDVLFTLAEESGNEKIKENKEKEEERNSENGHTVISDGQFPTLLEQNRDFTTIEQEQTAKLQDTQLPFVVQNMPFSGEGEINVQEGEGHQGESVERGVQPDAKDRPADTMEYEDTTVPQDTSLPVPARRERRRKMGSTRKSSRRAEVQTDRGEEEDVVMGQEREEGEESSLVEDELGSEITATSGEIQTEKQDEKWIHHNTDQDEENESQVGDRKTSGISTRPPEISDDSEQAEHSTFSVEKEREDKEESNLEREMEQVGTYHTPDISDYSDQAEHSTFVNEELHTDTPLTFGRTESVEQSEAESTKHENMLEDAVILEQLNQSEDSLLTEKDSALSVMLTDAQQRSLELEDQSQQSEEGEMRNVEDKSPGEDSKGDVLFTLAEESGNETIKENKEKEEERNSENSHTVISDGQSPTLLEQNQDFTTAEQEQTAKLQDTQLPLVVENMPVRCDGEINVQEGEEHQGESAETGIQPDSKDRSADTMEYEDTTLAQETAVPVPARRERRRKMGSTRKSSHRAEVQTDRGEEEDVVMGQEREEGEESSLVEEELGSEITATSGEIQTEKQDEKRIHQNTDQDKENESQVGDRKTSGISTRPPEISDDSEQAEHSTFSVEKEREDKEESNEEREMEQVGTYHTPDISDYSDQAEHSTFVNKELHTDTPLTFGRTESVEQSEAESTKHENMLEDAVILEQLNQSEHSLLTEKDSALSVMLTDAQQRSLELEDQSQQSEEGEMRNVEDKSPGEDSKGDVLFTLAEESGNETIKENKEKEEERNSENSHTVISDGQFPTLLEQNQDFTTAEQEQTAKLQDTQLPLVVENMPVRCDGEINVQEGEEHQGESAETGIQPDSKDRPADTMEYEDTTLAQETSLPVPARRERRRKMGSTRKSSRRAEVQTDRGEEEDVVMGQEREEGEESSLVEDELGSETAAPSGELQAEKQKEKRIHFTTNQEKGMEYQVGDRESSGISAHTPEPSEVSEQAEHSTFSVEKEREDKEESNEEREMEKFGTYHTPDISAFSDQAEHSTFVKEELYTDTSLIFGRTESVGQSEAESTKHENMFEDTVILDQLNQSEDNLLTEKDSALSVMLTDSQQRSPKLEDHIQKSEEGEMRNIEENSPGEDSKGDVLFTLAEESGHEKIKENKEKEEGRNSENSHIAISDSQSPTLLEQNQDLTTAEQEQTVKLQDTQLPLVVQNMPFSGEGVINVQEGEGHQGESVERGIQPDAKDRPADTMEYEDTIVPQETSLPVPAKRERRRKMGSTRKSSRRAEVQTDRGEEEDVIMGQEREEGEESSLVEDELGSEITATSGEIQTEKQDEKWIHQNTDQDKENDESQVGDRKTSGISTRPPEISDDSEQAEHSTFSVEKEREDKKESNEEREMEQVGTYHTPDIPDYSDQAEYSTFVNKELHTDTPLTFGRTESVGQSEAESTKHENMFEDAVILDQLNQSEDSLLTEKDSALSVMLTDSQQRSPKLEDHIQKSEEGEMRNIEENSPGEDSKGDVLFTLAEESGHEKIKENKEKEEGRNSENSHIAISDSQSPTLLEQNQDLTTAEQEQTVKLQDTQLPLVVQNMPFSGEGVINVQEGEGHQGESVERGIQPDAKDRPADTMEYEDTIVPQETSLPVPAKRERRRKMGSTRKSSRRAEVQTDRGEEEDVIMGQEREEGEESSLVEDELGSEITATSGEIQTEKQDEKWIHQNTDQDKENDESQVGDRKTSGISTYPTEVSDENMPVRCEGEINVQEGEGHQGETVERGIQPDAKDRPADTMEYEDTTVPQETSLPVPAKREGRRKMGSTRKRTRRAVVQTESGEEEDVVMGQEREEGEESSLLEDKLGSETSAPSGELQAEKQKEKRIHLIADEEKEMEYQVGDRESSGISAHTPEPSEFSEQAEHSTFSVEKEREDKEESKEEREMEKFGTYHTPDISDYSDQAEHSTFVKEELHTDTPLTFGRTESVGQSEAESTKHENMFEDAVILDQLNQSEDSLLTEKDSALSVMLTDAQQRSLELKDHSQQSEEGEMRNVEGNSPGEDSKGDVLFTLAEESGNEKIKENKEKEEERNSEKSHIVISDGQSPTLLEQNQDFTSAEQEQTAKLQDTQLPLVVENIPVRCDGEINVQEGEGHQGESVERGIQPDAKDRPADTMEYEDTTLAQETSLPVPARRERRRKMGSTRKSSRRAEVQTERGEEEDVVMGQEREEGEDSSLLEDELGSEITGPSGEIQAEKQDEKRIHQNTEQEKENYESQVGDRKTSDISTYPTEVSDENMPVRCEGEINVQEGEGHQGESVERGIQLDANDRSAETMEYEDPTLAQETALPVPARRERRRKMGSTRKSSRRAEVQTERGEEDDVIMGQEREEGEESSLLEDELGSETGTPSGELQAEKQKEKRIHLTTNQEKGMEYQVGDRESSGISAHTPEPSEFSEQAEHSTFSVEKKRQDKEENKEEREMEKFGTYHTPDISDYSDQAEHSTFVKEELHTDTSLIFGRTESVGQSEAESTKHENMFEDTVILDQPNQSEDSLLTEKDSALSVTLTDAQQRSLELEDHSQQSEEGETRNVEENSPGEDSKGDVLFTLAEESGHEKIKENKEKEEGRNSENSHIAISDSQSPTLLEQNQDLITAEQEQTAKLQDTQLPLVVENMPFSGEGEINVQEGEGHQGKSAERGIQPDAKDRPADTMEYEDTTVPQETSLPVPAKRERRRKMGSTRKSSRRAEVQTDRGEEEDVVMGQEREEGEESSLVEDELGSEITATSGEIQTEKQDEKWIHQNTDQDKENDESQVGDRKTSGISTYPTEVSDENMPVRCEGEINVQEGEGHQGETVERGIQPDAKDRPADTMEYEDTTVPQETSLPVPAKREGRRKMGSTRKRTRRAVVQTESGEEEDVVMGQEREEGEESSLLEDKLGSETGAPSRELQAEKQKEKRIHLIADEEKEMEYQVGDRESSGISAHTPEPSEFSEQAEHSTFSVEKEREDKEESKEEREMEKFGTYHTPDISDYSDQAEHSTFVKEELHTNTPLTFGRTESVGQSEAESTKHENMFEDTVILDQLNQSEDNLLTAKDSALSVMLTDAQQRSLELKDHSQQSEEGEMRNVEGNSPGEDSKGDVLFTLAEESGNEKIKENKEKEEERNSEKSHIVVSDIHSPTLLEQTQNFTTAEQVQTVKLQDTQLPLVVENIPVRCEGEINVQEGEGHQGETVERGIQPDSKDRSADTMEYKDTNLPQETCLPVPAKRERRRKLGSTRKSTRRAVVQTEKGEEEDVMGKEREDSSLLEDELGLETAAPSGELQVEQQKEKRIHLTTNQEKGMEYQVGDRESSGISAHTPRPSEDSLLTEKDSECEASQNFVSDNYSPAILEQIQNFTTAEQVQTAMLHDTQLPLVVENMPFRCEGKISVQEEEGHQGQSDKRGAEAIDKSADIMMSQNTSLPQDTSLPVPHRRERRRKLGSTRKSSRRAEAQTETGEEEDVMGQETEEDKESSLLDEGLGSEIAAPSEEMQAEKQKEMNIHQATEHSTFSVEKERANKEEREEREMEQVGMYHTPDISNYSAQVEHSFEKELASKNVVHHSADEHDSSAVPHRRRKMGSTRKGLLRSANQGEGEQLREQREKTEGEKGEMGEMLEGNDVNDTHKEEKGMDKDEALEREIMSPVQSPPFLEPPESSAIAGKQDKASPGVKKKLGSRRKGRSSVWKGDRDLGQANEMGVEEESKASAVLQRIQEVFHHCDPEENGFITWDHMQGLSGELGLSVEELRQVFDRLDKDRDGLVTPEDVTAGFQEFMQFQQPRARPAATVYQSDGSILPEEEDDGERKLFLSKLDDLRAYSLLQDQSDIWRLWVELQHNEPHLLNILEDFVSNVTEQIKTVQQEKDSLELALKRHIQQHSVGVKELYEEMERQIRTEKERVKEESLEKSRSQLAKLEEELDQKNSQIQTLNAVQSQLEGRLHALQRQQQQSGVEKQELFRANQELEEQLERIRAQLQESLSHLHALRSAHTHKPTHPHLLSLTDRAGQTEDSSGPEVLNLDLNVQTEKRDISHEAVVLERSGSQLYHSSPQGRCTGTQDEARRRVISIEEDPMPDLLTGGQALPHQNQGEVLWEKQRGQAWGERDSLSSVSHSPSALDLLYNVVLVGNSSVGKTCFMKRFQSGDFNPDLCATVGLDSCIQTVQVEGRRVILQLWDTAGQERYHSITKQILRKAQGLVLMYDITSSESFLALRSWLSSIQEGAPVDVIIILLGNKNDSHRREVSFEEGERLAREYSVHFMECSAATGDNVVQAMNNLARMLKQQVEEKQESNITLHKGSPKKKSGCCG